MDFADFIERIRIPAGITIAAVAAFWGSLGMLTQILLYLMALDLATGLIAAWSQKSVNSTVGWNGLAKKALTLGIVAAAAIVEPALGGLAVAQAVSGFYCATETLSVVENAAAIGVPIPSFLRDALVKVKDQLDGGDPGKLNDGGSAA